MFSLLKMFFLNWLYTPRESSLGGLTGGDSEDPLEETKDEHDEEYDQLYEEQINLNHSLVFP